MDRHHFRYQILRYIADLRRMEPENIGVIVQDSQQTSCRFHTRLGNRPDFDFDNYRRWREFFEAEINGPPVPIFQPARNDVRFLDYLQQRCEGNYALTRPLELVLEIDERDKDKLKAAQKHLFETLVLKPDEKVGNVRQPVLRLRNELRKRRIINHPYFYSKEIFKARGLTELVEYYYLRNHGENVPVIIQPVQVLPDISRTINAMERAEALVHNLRAAKVPTEISIVVDDIAEPSAKDSDQKKWLYDRIIAGKRALTQHDATIVDSTQQTVTLAASIEKDLSEIETSLEQTTLTYE